MTQVLSQMKTCKHYLRQWLRMHVAVLIHVDHQNVAISEQHSTQGEHIKTFSEQDNNQGAWMLIVTISKYDTSDTLS
jgi:hypothetical protein